MAQTSSSSLVSPGALLFGLLIGAFVTLVPSVGTYALGKDLTGTQLLIFLGLGAVGGAVAAGVLTRSS